MSIFSGLFHSRDKPVNKIGSAFSFLFGGTASGKAVNECTAMQTTAVYACVRILAESIAGLPLHIYRYRTDGGTEKAAYHPLYHLLHDEPNPEMTSFVFRETLMAHLLLWGNAYAQIIRNGRGQPVALYPLLPNKMEVSRSGGGEILFTYYRNADESGVKPKSGSFTLRKDEVLHIPGLGFDGLIGYSPIAMAKNAIGMALATEEYGATFFANGANPGGVLQHPGVVKDPQRVKESWNSVYRGSGNAHRVAVLEEGMSYHAVGIAPEQAQFLETRKFQINEIARIFRVPPHMVGDLEKSSFSNIEQQSLEFVKYTLDPWVVRWEQSLQQSLILPSEKSDITIRFNLDGLLRGDYASRMSGYATARQNGWMSANDIRELENLNRIPAEEGGDLYLINGNMTKLKDAGLFAGQKQTETEEKT
jgi:HK97 family phage portal protein